LPDDWSSERQSNGFQLGESLHLQADVAAGNHIPLRLFVDDCVATLSPDRNSSPRYALVDLSGCLVDGRLDDTTSAFISPRPRQETLQFTVDAFRFAGDERSLIYITCHLKVSPVDQAPNPSNKACSFNKASSLWAPVEGTGDICSCCETGNCPLYGGYSRRPNPAARWPGRRLRRDLSSKQGRALCSRYEPPGQGDHRGWDNWDAERSLADASHLKDKLSSSTVSLVAVLIAATVLCLTALGLFLVCRKCSCPPGVPL
uniref:Zona pellucida sperm-binding protein 3 n=1 Tax=Melopsittacus undulatus TaxID=13146 RepID=A0A8C6JQZ2_MELUD